MWLIILYGKMACVVTIIEQYTGTYKSTKTMEKLIKTNFSNLPTLIHLQYEIGTTGIFLRQSDMCLC